MLLAQLTKQPLGKSEAVLDLLVQAAVQKDTSICQTQARNPEPGSEQVLTPLHGGRAAELVPAPDATEPCSGWGCAAW